MWLLLGALAPIATAFIAVLAMHALPPVFAFSISTVVFVVGMLFGILVAKFENRQDQ